MNAKKLEQMGLVLDLNGDDSESHLSEEHSVESREGESADESGCPIDLPFLRALENMPTKDPDHFLSEINSIISRLGAMHVRSGSFTSREKRILKSAMSSILGEIPTHKMGLIRRQLLLLSLRH